MPQTRESDEAVSELEPYQIQAKPQIYNGIQMRSGLEVTIARAFDAIGLSWTYEPARYYQGKVETYLPDFEVELPVVGIEQIGARGFYDRRSPVLIEVKYSLENEALRQQAVRRAATIEATRDDPLIFVGLQELRASLAGWIISGDGQAIPGAITQRREYKVGGLGRLKEPCLYVGPLAEIWLDGFVSSSIDKHDLPRYPR